MDDPRSDIANKVAKAAVALLIRALGIAPCLVVVVASEDVVVVTMCGILTPQDNNLADAAKGSADSTHFHQTHFAQSVEPLRQEIERITETAVLKSSVDIDETTGSVVYSFTTGSVLSVSLLTEHTPADDWTDSEIIHQP